MLWGAALGALGRRLGNATAPSMDDVVDGVREAYDAMVRLGGAEPGDKTMLDAIDPFARTLAEQTADGGRLEPADGTASMRPRVGRARPLAERSVGTPDPGAVSFALCVRAVGAVMKGTADG